MPIGARPPDCPDCSHNGSMYAAVYASGPSAPPTPMGPLFRADPNLRSGDGPPAICQSRSEEHAVASGIICQCAPGFLHKTWPRSQSPLAHPRAGSPLLKQPPTLAAPRSYFPCPPVIIKHLHRSAGPAGLLQPPFCSAGPHRHAAQSPTAAHMAEQAVSKRL